MSNAVEDRVGSFISALVDERNAEAAALETMRDRLATSLNESETIVKHLRDHSAKAGIRDKEGYFSNAVVDHDSAATKWFRISIALIGILLLAILGSLFLPNVVGRLGVKLDDTVDKINFIASKVVFFVVLSYATLVAIRNFHSHKHNATVNRHRQNVVLSYLPFVDAVQETTMKQAILTQVAVSVFAPQETGFVNAGSIDGVSSKSVVEIMEKSAKAPT